MSDDRGSATLWTLALVPLVVLAAAVGALVTAAATARHRAETAADVAALTAARAALAGVPAACTRAGEAARANGARLLSCAVAQGVADVEVAVRPVGPLAGLGEAHSRSRAGPVDPAAPDLPGSSPPAPAPRNFPSDPSLRWSVPATGGPGP